MGISFRSSLCRISPIIPTRGIFSGSSLWELFQEFRMGNSSSSSLWRSPTGVLFWEILWEFRLWNSFRYPQRIPPGLSPLEVDISLREIFTFEEFPQSGSSRINIRRLLLRINTKRELMKESLEGISGEIPHEELLLDTVGWHLEESSHGLQKEPLKVLLEQFARMKFWRNPSEETPGWIPHWETLKEFPRKNIWKIWMEFPDGILQREILEEFPSGDFWKSFIKRTDWGIPREKIHQRELLEEFPRENFWNSKYQGKLLEEFRKGNVWRNFLKGTNWGIPGWKT